MYKSCAPGPDLNPRDDAGMEDALAGQPDNLGQSTLEVPRFSVFLPRYKDISAYKKYSVISSLL